MSDPAVGAPAPMCAVMIANYNGSGMIESCLRSVFGQRCSFDFEVIVHDDASTDDSARLIREQFPDVRLIASPENVGFCIANNRMAAVARGRYLLLLNNDAELLPDALETLYLAAVANDSDSILSLPQYDADSGALLDRGSLLDPFFNPVPNRDAKREQVAMVMGACLWIPRTLWEQLGGFPEWFGSIAEDMYICCMARLRGAKVAVVNASGYRHRVGQSFGGGKVSGGRLLTSRRRRALSERNKSFVMAIACPMPRFAVLLPVHLAVLMLEGLMLALWKRDWSLYRDIYGNCLGELWRARGQLGMLRRGAQSSRIRSAAEFFAPFTAVPYKLAMLMRYGFPDVR